MKEVLTISRHWDNPNIRTWISNKEIGLEISLSDFINALKLEVGSVTWTFTEKTFSEQIDGAASRVIEKIKESSKATVGSAK